MKDKNEYRIGF